MDCLSEGRIQGIVEGGLDTHERERAREHLENCADCRNLVGHAAAVLASGEAEDRPLEPLGSAFEPLAPGARVGRYVVEERLGSGAMGVVYAATDSLLQRSVALKLLRPSDAGGELERARLEREARAASAVKHPGVVAIFDVLATDDGLSVLVMDRLDGVSMRQYLRDHGPLDPLEVRELFTQILEALAAAHRTGIVHRDLKPENVFLTQGAATQEAGPRGSSTARVKLLDFGVAKLLATAFADSAGLTKSGTLVGTPYYMAPEQAFGATDLDQRADLWAVGVMLFEALVGERPLRGENVGQVLHQLAHFDFSGPRARLIEVAPVWEPLIRRLMIERGSRLQDASEALEILRGIKLHAGAASAAAEREPEQRPDIATIESSASPLPPERKRPWWAVPLALGIGGLFTLGFASRGGPSVAAQASSPAAVESPDTSGASRAAGHSLDRVQPEQDSILAETREAALAKAPEPALPSPEASKPEPPRVKPQPTNPSSARPVSAPLPAKAPAPRNTAPDVTPASATPAGSEPPTPDAAAHKPRLLTEPPF
ncbi:MAG: protein kinase [Myxococcales bacterium]|nr:protein kinase [Myxococcales bacterium]